MDFPRTSIAVTCVALLLRSSGVHGAESPMRQIVENTHRTQASVAVRQEYIEPLQLNGKTFRSALGILLEQGFRCAAKDGMAEIVRPDRRLPVRSLDAQHCVRERTQFELQPSTAAREGSATMDSLSNVVIRSQRSRCELTD